MVFRKIIILLLLPILFFSCKKATTEPEETSIIGNWQISGLANKWIVETISDQLLKIPYSGNGQIQSFGDYNSVFNGLILLNSNPLVIAAVELEYGMVITDALIIDGTSGIGRVVNSNTDQAFEGAIYYTFNGTTLTVVESILTNPQNDTETVTVSGAISFTTADIPANTQTFIQAPDIWMTYYYTSSYSMQFNDDNSILRSKYIDQELVNENGTWNMDNDMLTLNFNDEIESYSISTDVRTIYLVETIEICSNELDVNCFNEYEVLFGINDNSLKNLGVEIMAVFSKTN